MGDQWITDSTDEGFKVKYKINKLLFSKISKYQKIDIIENEYFGTMLFLDNNAQIAEKDAHIFNNCIIDPLIKSKNNLNNILILGCGDGGILKDLLKYKPKTITLVDIDKEVITASKNHLKNICGNSFSHPNVKVIIDDASKFLEKNNNFEAIIYDLTDKPKLRIIPMTTTHSLRDYPLEIPMKHVARSSECSISQKTHIEKFYNNLFSKIKNNLSKNGIISMHCCSAFNIKKIKLLNKILEKHFTNVRFTQTFIPSFCEEWIFASAQTDK